MSTVPGMLVAAVRRAPRFGARLTRQALQSKPGVVRVVELPNGIAVVARTYWQAHRAIEAAELTWSDEGSSFSSGDDLSPAFAEKLNSGPFFSHLKKGSGTATETASPSQRDLSGSFPGARHDGADELHGSRRRRSAARSGRRRRVSRWPRPSPPR